MAKEPLQPDERKKVLEARLKTLGLDASHLLRGEQLDSKNKDFVSTGQTEIDIALGDIPGFAGGSIVELIGEPSSGKTYLALKCAAEAHKLGKRVAFLNIENSFYEPRARALGVQTQNKDLFELYRNATSGEKWGELAKELAKSGDYGLIIIDSVTAMIPNADYNRSLEETAMIGAHARLVSRLSQRLLFECSITNTTCILINQFRMGAGVMKGTFAKLPTGGMSLGFYAHTRLVFSKINGADSKVYSSAKEVIGGNSKVFVLKNRFGPPEAIVVFPIYFSAEESDSMVEFLMRAKAKQYELISEVRKVYKYVTESGEVIESKNPKEFIKKLQSTEAPSKRVKGDDSNTAFEFICRKIKFNASMIEKLNLQLNQSDIEDSGETIVALSELTPEEIKEILKEIPEDMSEDD